MKTHSFLLLVLSVCACDIAYENANDDISAAALTLAVPVPIVTPYEYTYTSGGDATPSLQNSVSYDGQPAFEFGDIKDNEVSYFTLDISIAEPSRLSFTYKTDSEPHYDFLKLYDGTTLVGSWSGTNSPWSLVEISLTPGQHRLQWAYEKDYSVSTGLDTAWVSQIVCEPNTTPAADLENLITSDFEYTATAGGNAPPFVLADESAIQFGNIQNNQESSLEISVNISEHSSVGFSKLVDSERNYDYLRFSVNGSTLGSWSGQDTAYTDATFDLPAGECVLRWVYTKDSSVSVGEDTAFLKNISIMRSQQTPIDFSSVVTTEYEFTGSVSGDNLPVIDDLFLCDGNPSLKLGDISDGEVSRLELAVTTDRPRLMTFAKFVQSNPGYDFLKVYLNNNQIHAFSGIDTSWSEHSMVLRAGVNIIKFEYAKDGAVAVEDDAAWVSNIVIEPGLAAPQNCSASRGDYIDKVVVEWDPVPNALYNIYRSNTGTPSFTLVVATNATSYADHDVEHGMAYIYAVSAVSSTLGESDNSDTAVGFTSTTIEKIDLATNGYQAYSKSVFYDANTDQVFNAGNYWNGSKNQACYWRDAMLFDLPDGGNNSFATSIARRGSNTYVAGYYSTGYISIACYWVNGVRHDLTDTVSGGRAETKTIVADASSIYIFGVDENRHGCYWNDGTKVLLEDADFFQLYGADMVVENGTVYVGGEEEFFDSTTNTFRTRGCYWRNGAKFCNASNPTHSESVGGIAVQNGRLHLFGRSNGEWKRWSDGTEFVIELPARVTGLRDAFVDERGFVIVGGARSPSNNRGVAFVQKYGSFEFLDDGGYGPDCQAVGVSVAGTQIYVTGQSPSGSSSTPSNWKMPR